MSIPRHWFCLPQAYSIGLSYLSSLIELVCNHLLMLCWMKKKLVSRSSVPSAGTPAHLTPRWILLIRKAWPYTIQWKAAYMIRFYWKIPEWVLTWARPDGIQTLVFIFIIVLSETERIMLARNQSQKPDRGELNSSSQCYSFFKFNSHSRTFYSSLLSKSSWAGLPSTGSLRLSTKKKRKNIRGACAQTILELSSCKGGRSYALSPYLRCMPCPLE